MHTKACTGLLLLFTVTLSAAVADPSNLVRNPGFEYATSRSSAIFWQPFVLEFDHVTSSSRHAGRHSLRLHISDNATSANTNWRGVGQFIFLNQSSPVPLTLSIWAAGSGLTQPARAFLDVKYRDGTWEMDHTLVSQTGTFSWTRAATIVRPTQPIAAVFLYLIAFGARGSTAYFDDVALHETPAEAAAGPVASGVVPARLPGATPNTGLCDRAALRIHPSFLGPARAPDPGAVTVVTQLSPDRADRLQKLASLYNGPVSAAVFVRNPATELPALLSTWQASAALRAKVSVHLVTPCGPDGDSREYPINFLRNTAWEFAPTDQLLLLDVDFMPSRGLAASLASMWRRLQATPSVGRAAFVVPAFELRRGIPFPATKNQLMRRISAGHAAPAHESKLRSAHGATNFKRWFRASNAFEVAFEIQFEPYLLLSKAAPRYDDKFVGYGQDKVSHTYELHLAGYRLIVLPRVFVAHVDHPVPAWRSAQNATRVWVNWYSFVYDREREYGAGLYSKAAGVSGLPSPKGYNPFCTNTCKYANDGACDDGGPGSDYSGCAVGSDCADCGDRAPPGFLEEEKARSEFLEERRARMNGPAPDPAGQIAAQGSAVVAAAAAKAVEQCEAQVDKYARAAREAVEAVEVLQKRLAHVSGEAAQAAHERSLAVAALVKLRNQLVALEAQVL